MIKYKSTSLIKRIATKYNPEQYEKMHRVVNLADYLEMVVEKPSLAMLAHERVYRMIMSHGYEVYKKDGEERVRYKLFADQLFGIEDSLAELVNYFKSSSDRLDTRKRILLLHGPVSGAKSTVASILKSGLEAFSRTDEGELYAVCWPTDEGVNVFCDNLDDPLKFVPQDERDFFHKEHGIYIEGTPCPQCRKAYQRLEEKHTGDLVKIYADIRCKRVLLSEADRLGIGTFSPADPKSQDLSELVGSINFKTLPQVGSESDPSGWKFDGELNRSNRGIVEFIEMLKADERFLHILLTLAQERKIKTPRFPLISADEVIVGHSVAGEAPIPYRHEGIVRWTTLEELEGCFRKDSAGLEVLAYDFDTNTTRWTPVKRIFRHRFEGEMLTTDQKWGVVETTPNHSIYSRFGETFYPEERQEILAVRQIVDNFESDGPVNILDGVPGFIPPGSEFTSSPPREGARAPIKSVYNLVEDADQLKALITVFVRYATEGHVNGRNGGIVISQADPSELERVRQAYSIISNVDGPIDAGAKADTARGLYIGSSEIAELAKHHCGELAHNKRLPDFLFRLPKEFLQHAFDELMRTDGSRKLCAPVKDRASDEYRKNFFDYKTISPLLAAQVGTLATLLGFDYSVGRYQSKGKRPRYRVRFCNGYGKQGGRHKRFSPRLHRRKEAEPIWVYDIECVGLHNFVCGVGNVVCHNTNESEYSKFVNDPTREALMDRMIKIDFKYNLIVSEELKIYNRLMKCEAKDTAKHRAPNTFNVAAIFGVLTRLEESSKCDLITKIHLYNGEVVDGFKEKDVKEIKKAAKREGLEGVSPRLIVNVLAEATSMDNVQCLTPFVVMTRIRDTLERAKFPKIAPKKQEEYLQLIDVVRKEYEELAKKDVLKAFLASYGPAMEDLCANYIDHVEAYVEKQKLKDYVTGEEIDPDETLMKSIEDRIENIGDNRKEQFRSSLMASIGGIVRKGGKFTYKSDERLRKAIEKKIFDDNKGNIRITTFASSKTDEANLKKLEAIKERMIAEHGYCEHCARDVMNYVGSILAKGDIEI